MLTRAKKELDSGAVVIPGQSHCPYCQRWQCGPWPLCLWKPCHLRNLLDGEESTCLHHCCGWGTKSTSCYQKILDEGIVFVTVSIFGGLVLPCPLIVGLLLLVLHFLWWHFLGCQFLAHCLGLVGFVGCALMFLFQGINFSSHCNNLFLFFSGLAPSILFVQ